jgi:hypothetical protein
MRLGAPTPSPTRRGVVSLTCDPQHFNVTPTISSFHVRWRAPHSWTHLSSRPLSPVDSHGTYDGLPAVVHMNMLNPHELRAAVP